MDFSFSEEQTLLKESIERFIQNDYGFNERQETVKSEADFNASHWRTYAELGWLAVPFAEADGGFGGGPVESIAMWEQFGKGLVIEPLLATVVLAGGALRLAGTKAQKQAALTGIVNGESQAALAFAEPQGRYNLADLTTSAVQTQWRLASERLQGGDAQWPVGGLAGGIGAQCRGAARRCWRLLVFGARQRGRRQSAQLPHRGRLRRLGSHLGGRGPRRRRIAR